MKHAPASVAQQCMTCIMFMETSCLLFVINMYDVSDQLVVVVVKGMVYNSNATCYGYNNQPSPHG